MADKRIDTNSWGSLGTALLPESLRLAWASEPLPDWVAADFGLPNGSTFKALDQSVWNASSATALTDRQRNFLLNLVQTRRTGILPLRVFHQPLPYWLNLKELSFSTRTRNCLVSANFLTDPAELSQVTFGRLFDVRAMGVVSILELACGVESAIQRASPAKGTPFDASQVMELISEPWVDQVGPADPRFADLIPPLPYATVFEMLNALTSAPDVDEQTLTKLAQSMPELRKRLRLIKALPLEQQLSDFLRQVTRFDGDRLLALIDRLGWGGSLPITLEEAGTRLDVTRERFRQLQERAMARLKEITFPPYIPGLDSALALLREKCPVGISAATEILRQHNITGIDFHPESLIAAAEACRRKPPICLQTVGKRTIVAAAEISNADEILRIAFRQTQASGASNVGELTAELRLRGIETDEESVGHVLREFSDVHFFEDNWFGRRPDNPERDRLRNVTRKMLSVASPIDVMTLREGIRREYRYRGHRGGGTWSLIVPPRSVLRAYYQIHPEFLIDENDMVRPAAPLDYRTELALNEAIMVDVLRSSPTCVLDRQSLASECARRSMNINTFSLYVTYSPVIVHLGTDIWSLRGMRIDPTAIEAVRSANALRPKEKRILDHGWTDDGQLWVAARLPATHLGSPVLGIPGAIRSYLAGRQFAAKDEDGVSHGTIKINDEGSSYGFGPFLRQRGADEGDILIAEFNLAGDAALLRLGNDELLEEISPEV